ncbi:non-ribosomal peptide synthetase [Umezawaea sp. Da 62-37]|uniref:non-ribosomal peptide synthetase n=1 Tax=Umezawaea sp. Da 62-37 TaxID=3075927 RepID=UPI0028F6EBA4|nr:non-ribosomal peptide synthetase [Umezawaea sp. Da 62-37]WNV87682.1 amino acid adenylation domain-containing protein [Umezawaea sp. Da 62-37]
MAHNTSDRSLHRLVENSAARTPGAAAVITPDRTLTYRELDELAEAVAVRLRPVTGPDRLVAVAMRKGWEQVVAVLGVLKSGAAYLPVDPGLPAARLRQVLDLAECATVLTQPGLLDGLTGVDLSVVDDELTGVAGTPSPDVPRDLAYVIFTSGSTGVPKGVMIEHGGVTDTVLEIDRRFGVGPADRTIGLSSLSFDLSVYDIFGPLAVGGALVLPSADTAGDPAHWVASMRRHGVSVWHTVPALMGILLNWLEDTGTPAPPALRLVVLTGDWIPVGLPGRVRGHFPDATVVSMGGATETSINSLVHVIGDVDPSWTSIPYGVPLPGEDCLVLDDDLRPVPDGRAGELCVTGTGLARGYWRDPERTAASFPTHPDTGKRLYRTGDRGRRTPDGRIEFLGRTDNQVKVNGYRVELGDVEAALLACPGVHGAAAVATGPRTALTGLTAFVVTDDFDAARIRTRLDELLPAYLVPGSLHPVTTFPLTANGKVDRAALRELADGSGSTGDGEPPRPGTEQRVADLLTDLIGRPVTSRTTHFFDLGGNSLLSAQVATRLRREFTVDVPIGLALTHPTVERMARALHEAPERAADTEPALVPRSVAGTPSPVSFGQEQVWFLDRLVGGNRAYHFQCGVRFTGTLRPELVQRALTGVVARHEILRTTFHDSLDGPVQVVHPPAEVPLPQEDLRHHPESEREAALKHGQQEEIARSFDLEQGPLIVWKLYRVADDDWVITETEHHLVHDGWSVAVFWREVSELYGALVRGEEPELDDLPVQFADFSAWQRERYLGGRQAEVLPYWQRRLAGVTPFDLAISRPRPTKQTFTGRATRVALPAPLYARLREFAAAEGLSLFVLMFSAFTLLMHRYSGARDLCVGSWMANRDRAETENLIGMLVNMVGLRTEVTGAESFRELASRTRTAVLEALDHQDAPFEDVVRALDLPRDASRNPLVQTCFSFHDSPVPAFDWPDAVGTLTEYHNDSAKFDVNVVVVPRAEQLRTAGAPGDREQLTLIWEYNTDLIDPDAAERMVGHFQRLLSTAVDTPDAPVDSLDMLVEADREAIAAGVPEIAVDETGPTLVDLFRSQVAALPDAVAVRAGDDVLTYRQLHGRAAGLAGTLIRRGIGTGDRVAVCVDRSCDLVVALLGTVMTGAAYVPLDHRHPKARNDFMLADAGVEVVVTERGQAGLFADRAVVLVDECGSGDLAAAAPDGDDLAYVLYTSGSTGDPKGVRVPHGALSHLLRAISRQVGITDRDVLLAVTTATFDIAALELFAPLVVGGAVVIAPTKVAADGEALAALLAESRATVMQATPMTWRMLSEVDWRPTAGFTALCGGEAMPADLAAWLANRVDTCWNLYGPTETTIWSTAHRVRGDETSVPIGRPLANTDVRVLDPSGQPSAVGLPGELHIGGAGLAAGYTSPALTAERFVDLAPGQRFYRTGDVVRRLPNGDLQFLHRVDGQVKLHGYRIELEEVEHALRAHDAVADCAVDLRGEPMRLVGYFVSKSGAVPTNAELAAHLAGLLPAYMVPVDFVVVAAIPVSVNGKTDRRALPDPVVAPADEPDPGTTEALSEKEEDLARIWAEVLGRERVGAQDDFFILGGHSLLALRLVSRIKARMSTTISVDLVFDHPTVRELASVLDAGAR